MRRVSFRRFVAVLLTVVAAGSLSGTAAVANRIRGAVSDAQVVAQEGSVSSKVRGAVDHGRLVGATPLTGLSINFLPSPTQQSALDALLQAQQDSSSASYHKWLTPAQFGARFGMSDSDLAAVAAWLQSHGLQVTDTAPSRNAIHFSGTVTQVEQAFQTELHALSVDGEAHFANTTAPMLPSAFAGTVGAVRGLNDFRPRPHVRSSHTLVPYSVGGRQLHANATPVPLTTDGTGIEYISPEDFAKIYNASGMYNAGFKGSASYPIGIVGQTAINPQDITDFRTSFGLPSNPPTLVLVPNTGTSTVNSTGDLSESELDLEWSGAVAPSAPIYFVYTGGATSGSGGTSSYLSFDVFNALQYAIQMYTVGGKPLPILSISYGECEPSDTATDFATYESWFQQANAQGQTVISASGDDGAAGCDYSTTATNNYAATKGLAVDYPASSAYVTGVGGTSYSGDVTSLSTYWGSTNDTNFGNELGLFIPSTSWNNTPTTTDATNYGGLGSSGGGVSSLWPKPSWQTGVAGIPADGKRDVPDVAFNADPNHDGYLVCINLGCEGANASFNVYGGTSVSAPSFAGILALAEQRLNTSEGNLNPLLYSLATTAATSTTNGSVFHDITTGSNIVPCVVVSTDVGCSGGTMGYSAGTGYDLVTGLGAVDAFNLANSLSGAAAKAPTTMTLTYQPSSPVTGQTVSVTATVGTTAAGAVPTGTIIFTVDGVTSSSSVPVSGTGTATYSTSFATGGSHTVSAVYSGDGTYYGSTSTISFPTPVAANPNNATTTTTLTASAATVPVGSSLTLTASVSATAAGMLAGTVTFTGPSVNGGPGIVIGRQALTVGATGITGTAVLPVVVKTLAFPVGNDTITASFDGGGVNGLGGSYTASPAAAATVTVTNPTINITATNITLTNGSTGISTITLGSTGGYAGTITLQATTSSQALLTYATATFTPPTVALTVGGSGTATVTFTTATTINGAAKGAGKLSLSSALSPILAVGGVSLAGLFGFGLAGSRRRRMPSMLLSLLILTLLGGAMGCSSSSSTTGGSGGTTTSNNIPTGVYTITIIGNDSISGVTGSTNITLTIK